VSFLFTIETPFTLTYLSHKTLRGPRAGLIFFKKDGPNSQDLEKRVNDAVFPACQGGPHNNVGTPISRLSNTS
jgi:glycine hydroxymethyltransferase